jgi:ankyrin repeat protein
MVQALPADPDLDWLRKTAKQRLARARARDAGARLHLAQLELAREYGFTSWRALKAAVDAAGFDGRVVDATRRGDAEELGRLLDAHPRRAQITSGRRPRPLLHLAAERGDLACIDVMLGHCADPGQRDRPDRATALHWAAWAGHLPVVERLLAAGCDPDDRGDAHEIGPLGWATCLGRVHEDVADVLLARGARLHVFAAISLERPDAVRSLVAADPGVLRAVMSRFEHRRTPLHHAVVKDRPRMVSLLLGLGASPAATDADGHTPLHYVRTFTDPAIAGLLFAAGAPPEELSVNQFEPAVPIFTVSDVPKALDYYVDKLGFRAAFTWEDPPTFATVARDDARIFLSAGRESGQPSGAWIAIFLPDVDALHREYVESGALIVTPPADYPWGVREMRVQDPDGNVIRMGTGTEDE